MIHGALGASRELTGVRELFDGYQHVLNIDLLGHGPRANEEFTMNGIVEDLKTRLETEEISNAEFFGFSMGGYVALLLAHRYPHLVKRITTLGTKLNWTPEIAASEIRKLNPDKIEEKVPKFASYLASLHGEEQWENQMASTRELILWLGDKQPLNQKVYSEITCQVTVLRGDSDDMVGKIESVHAVNHMPNACYAELENTLHPIARVNPLLLKKHLLV